MTWQLFQVALLVAEKMALREQVESSGVRGWVQLGWELHCS